MSVSAESLREDLRKLKLGVMAANLETLMEEVNRKNLGALALIKRLVDMELEARWKNSIGRRFSQSRLIERITIDQFDFHFHKSREEHKGKILGLLDLDFIGEKKDVIFIGNPGTGKTMLAKCIALGACNANIKVLFTTAIDMINHLVAADADRSLLKQLHLYQAPDLLVCDELGYLPLGSVGSNLFFQVISQRHRHRSSVLTTNLPFADWGKVFDSTTVAAAIADRLVYNSEIIILGGPSYRRKQK
jgi:DNA replication protein DnaC